MFGALIDESDTMIQSNFLTEKNMQVSYIHLK